MLSKKNARRLSLALLGSAVLFSGCSPSDSSTATDNSTSNTVADTTAPTVQGISPEDGATRESISATTIAVTFSEAMDTSTISTNTNNTTCSGTIQVSADNFTTCVQMSAAPVASNSNATFTLTPADNLSYLTSYLVKVTTNVKDNASNILANNYITSSGFQTDYSPSPFVLFASQYDRLSAEQAGAWTKTKEGGLVYVSEGYSQAIQDVAGKWDYGSYETDAAAVVTRQSYGKQYFHDTALADNDTIYITVKAPNGEFLNVSESDQLVIQMGNGADQSTNTNSHNVFTITLNGGEQDTSNYSWNNSCSVDQQVSSTNAYGLNTYYIGLDNLTCSSGSISALKEDLEEVVVKVIGGKNPASDNTTSANYTMPSVGFIGFSQETATVADNSTSPYVLFASQYEPISGATQEPYIISQEGGAVFGFSGGNFSYSNYGVTAGGPGVETAQSWGAMFNHTSSVTSSDYFGWTIKGPDNGSINAKNAENLVIQLGNAANLQGQFGNPSSHMVFTLDLKNGSTLCSYDLTLDNSTRPDQTGANVYGLNTYEIPISSFSGGCPTLVNEVAIKVVGGKDPVADNSTSGNATLPVFGFIGFSK